MWFPLEFNSGRHLENLHNYEGHCKAEHSLKSSQMVGAWCNLCCAKNVIAVVVVVMYTEPITGPATHFTNIFLKKIIHSTLVTVNYVLLTYLTRKNSAGTPCRSPFVVIRICSSNIFCIYYVLH